MAPRTHGLRVQGVILDWSGTTIDYGCFAPTVVFMRLFEEYGVPISVGEARAPMGAYKRDHISQIMRMPDVAERWRTVHGRHPNDDDIQAMYEAFVPEQMACITDYADPIPGVPETIARFRESGLKIGSTTGYTRDMMRPLLPVVEGLGYRPDAVVCPDDVRGGRPAPWMCFQNAMTLDVYPMSTLIKIGDTLVDIEEGRNAGMWTIGLTRTGNELGLSAAEVEAMPAEYLQPRLEKIAARFAAAGAHFSVESLADTPDILDQIGDRLRRGERP